MQCIKNGVIYERDTHLHCILVSWGCRTGLPQTGWLKKKPKIYFLTVLEPRSLKSRYQHGHTPFDIFPVICWQSLAILGLKLPKSSNFTFSLCAHHLLPPALPARPTPGTMKSVLAPQSVNNSKPIPWPFPWGCSL